MATRSICPAACAFASGFYDAILAGRSLEVAMRRGIAQLQVSGFVDETENPQARYAQGLDPGEFRLLGPRRTASAVSGEMCCGGGGVASSAGGVAYSRRGVAEFGVTG